jgi:hypothetical protein
VCGGDGSSCRHPLTGRYAVRTQLYARQKAVIAGTELDLVSKVVVVSVADIDPEGVAHEHYCFLELSNTDGLFSWSPPTTVERVPDTAVQLEQTATGFVRPLDEHRAYFSWSPQAVPADCVAGQVHATGCRCPSGSGLPTRADDCRVLDLEQDAVPGGAMYLGFAQPTDPNQVSSDLKLNIVTLLNLEWQLGASAGQVMVGDVGGGLDQAVLSMEGGLAAAVESINNAVCPPELGHVELVRGDFSCASVLAGRATDAASYGIFDPTLDGVPPAATACPDPSSTCTADTDGDGSSDCDDGCPADRLKTAPGACGCGVADTNSDGDPAADCTDGCPNDPAKLAPGTCGCGVADTNSDGDPAADCTDGCPNDPAKLAPGTCGCGVADRDLNGDGSVDCGDGCPDDPAKIAPGLCGCGVADTNTDGDAAPDCSDECDGDATKTAAGACGCGVADTNTDGDAAPDCSDECDGDATKTAPGVCGCGSPDEDRDGDGLPTCNDACPDDASKTTLGLCGCSVADTDSDGDGAPDCTDGCDNDPAKTAAGACGCGVADTNTDGDSAPDCTDACDGDPAKTAAGDCGCGVADTNSDGDAMPDCTDQCDSDPAKTAPGACGCGVADTNSDGDSAPDCTDGCDADPAKSAPGICGCGIADQDLNGDGTVDCSDSCPADPAKVAPGICGCGVPDTNTDGDSLVDCREECDSDPAKQAPGQCGCGVADTDADGDGVASCNDACPNDPNKTTLGTCGCSVADTNSDGDGAPDCTDECDNDPTRTAPGPCGCMDCQASPMAGTYAVRAVTFSKSRDASSVLTTKSLGYSLITISENTDRSLTLSERACWTQALPRPGDATQAYSWSKPAWVQAVPLSVQTLTNNNNGTYSRSIPLTHLGWDPARQPSDCSATSTPLSPWPSAWGTTCRCSTPANALPPYDINAAPYDCRLADIDGDGQPGMSAIAATSAPSSPDANAPALGGTVYAALDGRGTWLITQASNGRHTASIADTSEAQVVGCTGLACSFLTATPPPSRTCSAATTRVQFVPTTTSFDTCAEIIAQRSTLWDANQDPPFPDDAACAPPP